MVTRIQATEAENNHHRILITGGSGFIGTNILQHLLSLKFAVRNVDIQKPKNPQHLAFWDDVDIRKERDLLESIQRFRPTRLLHLAARTDLDGRDLATYSANTSGTRSVVNSVMACQSIEKAVFVSSMLVCRAGYLPSFDSDYCPTTIYGESKVIAEQLVRNSGMSTHWTIVRPSSIWGPWFGAPYRDFFVMLSRGQYVGIGKCATKTYGYVGNSVFQICRILMDASEKTDSRTFYIGDEPALNINEWADEILHHLGRRTALRIPSLFMRMIAYVGDAAARIGLPAPFTSFRFKNMTTNNILPLSELYRLCGGPPFDMSSAIDETLEWMLRARLVRANRGDKGPGYEDVQ